KDAPTIELEDVTAVRRESIGQMIRDVHQPALRDLSPGKLAYLEAMLDDDGPTRVADIEQRLGKSPGYQSVYRDRLINDEMIRPTQRGYVELAMPYLREALLERLSGTQYYTRTPTASISAARRPGTASERSHLDRSRGEGQRREHGYGR
ncbi:ATP-binding protein, partial [Brachybacterium sp. AOP42-B2-9]